MIDLKQLLEIVSGGGLLGLVLAILWAGAKGYWVWGWQYRELQAREKEWREFAIHGTHLATRAVSLAAKEAGQESPK